ncbi:MAG: carbamoyl phosphate synthase small subunit, partial [Phycisphaerales bacterium]
MTRTEASTDAMSMIEAKPGQRAATNVAAVLELEDGTVYEGVSFGADVPRSAEIVFNTGMVGYPEMLTDPSYTGEIIVSTYPMVGNYGVPAAGEGPGGVLTRFESSRIHAAGLVVAHYCDEPSHWNTERTLGQWLRDEGIPAITGIDTRALTKRLREKGTMLGVMRFEGRDDVEMTNPFANDLVSRVTIDEPKLYGAGEKRIALVDCGSKLNILRSLLARHVEVLRVPADYDLTDETVDGVVISNGPGDPEMVEGAVPVIRKLIERQTPIFG